MKHSKIDIVEFVDKYMETYEAGGSYQDVADFFKVDLPTVSTRKAYLKQHYKRDLPRLRKSMVNERIQGIDAVFRKYGFNTTNDIKEAEDETQA